MAKILIVDDEPEIKELLSFILQRAGHSITQAGSGDEALELVRSLVFRPDLILMDVNMPGMDGYESTREIRKVYGEHWIPIIFITAEDDIAGFEEGIECGGDDYLVKPFNPAVLQAKVKAFTRIAEAQNRLEDLIAELTMLSQQDSLTRLYNRRSLMHRAEQAWQMAERENSDLSIIMMDVDHFKAYNDSYGHVEGDECLVAVSDVVRSCVFREVDLIGRYGGEEFIIVLPGTPVEGAVQVAEKVCSALALKKIEHKSSFSKGYVTASFGVACRVSSHGNIQELITDADELLYRAKAKGRDCVVSQNDL